jgi:hypothetical protein
MVAGFGELALQHAERRPGGVVFGAATVEDEHRGEPAHRVVINPFDELGKAAASSGGNSSGTVIASELPIGTSAT